MYFKHFFYRSHALFSSGGHDNPYQSHLKKTKLRVMLAAWGFYNLIGKKKGCKQVKLSDEVQPTGEFWEGKKLLNQRPLQCVFNQVTWPPDCSNVAENWDEMLIYSTCEVWGLNRVKMRPLPFTTSQWSIITIFIKDLKIWLFSGLLMFSSRCILWQCFGRKKSNWTRLKMQFLLI